MRTARNQALDLLERMNLANGDVRELASLFTKQGKMRQALLRFMADGPDSGDSKFNANYDFAEKALNHRRVFAKVNGNG